jgi:diguanylate cyclase (GGDEF)-like protein
MLKIKKIKTLFLLFLITLVFVSVGNQASVNPGTWEYFPYGFLLTICLVGMYKGLTLALIFSAIAVFIHAFRDVYLIIATAKLSIFPVVDLFWLISYPLTGFIVSKFSEELEDVENKFEEYAERIDELIIFDEITGFDNVKRFHLDFASEVSRARRYDFDLSLMMIKIEHYDELGEIYGAYVKEDILKKVADILKNNLREVDKKARIKEDELAIILPQTSKKDAITLLKRLDERLHELKTPHTGTSPGFNLSFKFGLVSYPEDGETASILEEKARMELTRVKLPK